MFTTVCDNKKNMAEVGLPRFSRECYNCGLILRLNYNHCPEHGTEADENNEHPDYDKRAVIAQQFKKSIELIFSNSRDAGKGTQC